MNRISIVKDKIILHWDGLTPQSAPPNSIKTPADVVYFWPHLLGFARAVTRSHDFSLDFSKQNMLRLHKQFGSIPLTQGKDAVELLKKKQSDLVDMVRKAILVKELPVERLPTYDYKMSPLGEYQHRGVILMNNIKCFPLFADCGMGKTYMVLVSTERQIKLGMIPSGSTLVCAKLNTIEAGWLEDAKKFTNLNVVSLWEPQSKKKRERILEKLNSPADVYVINHDGLRVFEEELTAKKFRKVVVDESTILKGFHGMNKNFKGGAFGRSLMNVSANADWRVVMSGTPAPNGIQDLYGQFMFLDPDGLFLEASFRDFQNEYMEMLDLRSKKARFLHDAQGNMLYGDSGAPIQRPRKFSDPAKWVPKKGSTAKVAEVINPISYRLKIRDHIKDLPELTMMKRVVEMDAEQARHYKDMEERLKVELDDVRITVPIKLAKIMKLRQITGGFIIDNEENAHVLPLNPKMDELDSLIEDEIAVEDKVIIYAEYRWEIESILSRYKGHGIVSVYGGNSSAKNLENINRFINDDKIRIIVLHPKSAAHGITFTCAHYMIFYSFSHSAEDSYQSIKRIERAGQKHPMFVYHLIANKAIDADIYQVIKVKNSNQEELLDADSLLISMWNSNAA